MKIFIPTFLLFLAVPLHSSPMAQKLQLVGQVQLSKITYQVILDADLRTEKAHTTQYMGQARLISGEEYLERPMTLYIGKKSPARMIVNILMSGSAQNEGLYLELVSEDIIRPIQEGNLISAQAELMWVIKSPYRDLSETSYITRDRGQSGLEVLESL